jgi:hypothetical protein
MAKRERQSRIAPTSSATTSRRTGAPTHAVDSLTRKQKAKKLKAQFDAAHRQGMQALRQHDLAKSGDAIAKEVKILEAQRQLLLEQRNIGDALNREIAAFLEIGKQPAKSKKR